MSTRRHGARYPVSHFQDLKETYELMESAGGNVRSYLAIFYNTVLVPFCDIMDKPGEDTYIDDQGKTIVIAKQSRKGRTVPELIEQTKLMLGFTPSRTEMHSKYLTPMINLGLVNWEKSVKKGSENIYFADIFLSDPETCFKTGWDEMKDLDSRKNENEKDTPTLYH